MEFKIFVLAVVASTNINLAANLVARMLNSRFMVSLELLLVTSESICNIFIAQRMRNSETDLSLPEEDLAVAGGDGENEDL